jgi:site-specific recombinase XerD
MLAARELLERFVLAKKAAGKAPRTLRWYEDLLGEYIIYTEEHGLAWSETETIEQYQAHLWSRDLAANSVDCHYRALRAWFNWMVRRKLFAAPSPMEGIERPARPTDPVQHVTLAEFSRLFASIEGDDWTAQRDRCLLLLLFWSGLRVAEAVGLRLEDVDIATRLVTVRRGKGGKSRAVPCAPELAASLLNYLMSRPPAEGDTLFVSNDGYGGVRGRLTAEGVRQMLRRRCKSINMRHLHPHLFRHGFAMLFLNNGMQMSAVSAAMGHSSQQVTADIYAQWTTAGLTREYDAVHARVARTIHKG